MTVVQLQTNIIPKVPLTTEHVELLKLYGDILYINICNISHNIKIILPIEIEVSMLKHDNHVEIRVMRKNYGLLNKYYIDTYIYDPKDKYMWLRTSVAS